MEAKDPSTREQIAAFLRQAGYDPEIVGRGMEVLADTIIAKERAKRIDAWLDSLADIPLTPEDVDAIMASLEAQRRSDAPSRGDPELAGRTTHE